MYFLLESIINTLKLDSLQIEFLRYAVRVLILCKYSAFRFVANIHIDFGSGILSTFCA